MSGRDGMCKPVLVLERVVRREQSSSIAIELTFATSQMNKGNLKQAHGLLRIVNTIRNRNTGKIPRTCSKFFRKYAGLVRL